MKTVTRFLLTFLLLLSLGGAVFLAWRNWMESAELADLDRAMRMMEESNGPDERYIYGSAYRAAALLDGLFAALAVAAIACLFLENRIVGMLVAGTLAATALLAFFFQPSYHGMAWRDDDFERPLACALAATALICAAAIMVLVNRRAQSGQQQVE